MFGPFTSAPIPPYPDGFMGPRNMPSFDGKFAHGTTTNPALNRLFEITNATQANLEMMSYQMARFGGPGGNPGLGFYQNSILPGLNQANQIYQGALQPPPGGQGQGGGGESQGGGGPSAGKVVKGAVGFAAAGAVAGGIIGNVPGAAVGAVAGGIVGGIASLF